MASSSNNSPCPAVRLTAFQHLEWGLPPNLEAPGVASCRCNSPVPSLTVLKENFREQDIRCANKKIF